MIDKKLPAPCIDCANRKAKVCTALDKLCRMAATICLNKLLEVAE